MNKVVLIVLSIFVLPFLTCAQSNKTEILILGTTHLGNIEGFKPSMVAKVIQKLNTFEFNAVCIEKMPGQLLYDIKSRNDNAFDVIVNGNMGGQYLAVADTVQEIMELSFNDATAAIDSLLKKKNLSDPDRKLLFYNYLATTDIPSAALQYKYLKGNSDLFVTDFDKYLISIIEKKISSHNEVYTIALPLAYEQLHNKIEAIDNFQDEVLLMKYYPHFIQDLQAKADEVNAILKLPVYKNVDSLTTEGLNINDLSALYSFINSEDYMIQDYNGQWKIWLKTNLPSGSDKARLALWEMRNLQIAANILNVVSLYPGQRIIVIIGSSHKSFIEKFLGQIEVIDLLDYK